MQPPAQGPAFRPGPLIERICISQVSRQPQALLVMMPGRGMGIEEPLWIARSFRLEGLMAAAFMPAGGAFYPPPKNAMDQDAAVAGLPRAGQELAEAVGRIASAWNIPWAKVASFGFSAGGVMTYQLAQHAPIRAGVVVCGTVLDPVGLRPPCDPMANFLAIHHYRDHAFNWEERHLPAKDALRREGWRVRFIEDDGGHQAYSHEMTEAKEFLQACLGLEEAADVAVIKKPKRG